MAEKQVVVQLDDKGRVDLGGAKLYREDHAVVMGMIERDLRFKFGEAVAEYVKNLRIEVDAHG